ncbi:alpha/beta fold hydrolase [Crossiella cryophila]|uniref:Pimeloyl-ACP methyl ester carboxylesterase n=1 Tax=Crossiella cryophila TaxID=43355 RepID=A0A7W7CDT3_9PSEU|nr:alpha/beta fold hydrolase [Crossiella cryophila]MBB4679301.1 pimeloyl-ACP methyl ester carboxylesterase [Crossiella cryophila]
MNAIYRTPESQRLLAERYRALLTRWPVPSDQETVSTSDGDTFVISSGPADAPPLVLLHGSGGNATAWLEVAAAWSEHFRLHAIDIPGEPGLSNPDRMPMTSGAHVRWLSEVLGALGVRRAPFVATSLSGQIALDQAVHRPEQVERLALVCPSGIGRQTFGWLPKALLYGLQGEAGRRKLFRLIMGTSTLPAEMEEYLLFVNRHFRPRRDKIRVATDEELAGLDLPMMVGIGGKDVLLDSAQTQSRLAGFVPRAKVHLSPGTGHYVPVSSLPVLEFLLSQQESRA